MAKSRSDQKRDGSGKSVTLTHAGDKTVVTTTKTGPVSSMGPRGRNATAPYAPRGQKILARQKSESTSRTQASSPRGRAKTAPKRK